MPEVRDLTVIALVTVAVMYETSRIPVSIQTTATSRPPTPVGVLFSHPPVISTLDVHQSDSQTPCRYGAGKFSSLLRRSNHQSRCDETSSAAASMPRTFPKSQ